MPAAPGEELGDPAAAGGDAGDEPSGEEVDNVGLIYGEGQKRPAWQQVPQHTSRTGPNLMTRRQTLGFYRWARALTVNVVMLSGARLAVSRSPSMGRSPRSAKSSLCDVR